MLNRKNSFFMLKGDLDTPRQKRLYARSGGRGPGVIQFEAVDADWMDRFLGEGASPDLWREVGPDAPVSVLEISRRNWELLRRERGWDVGPVIQRSQWLEFEIGDGGVEIDQYLNLHAGPRKIPVDRIMTVEAVAQRSFARLLDLSPYVATRTAIEAALPSPSTRIDWVAVYDVGQGSANALLDESGVPCIYADLGGGVLGHRTTFPAAFGRLCLTARPPIILSHWDWDHWSSGGRFPHAQLMTWIVPNQTYGIVHGVFAALIVANGTLMVWPRGLRSVVSGQITVLKCTGTKRNNSGLAVSVEGPEGQPPILLPGDASYWHVPTGSSVHHSVVATHHGALTGATMPVAAGSPLGRVVYSYGLNNQWKHPRPATMSQHDAAGWPHATLPAVNTDRHTVHRAKSGPALGHIGLSWNGGSPPTPPCGGDGCDQAIVQT
jgi:hypothetical protein